MERCCYTFLCLAMGFLTSCGQSPENSNANQPLTNSNAGARVYEVKGVVVSLNIPEREVTIKHEEIPGYMQPMTMPFAVKKTNELAGLSPGDPVSFRMFVTEKDGWIEGIHKQAGAAWG